jgi:pyrroline-5-carboxylate reductase
VKKLLLIGAGNMVRALWSKEWAERFELLVYTPSGSSADKFVELYGGKRGCLDSLPNHVDYLFLGHKPQQCREVATLFSKAVSSDTAIISILASITTEQLSSLYGVNSVLRLMPNTPAKVGRGTITFFQRGDGDFTRSLELLGRSSRLIGLADERQIDITTPVTGSGPAFLFELARIWQQFLEQQGIATEQARDLVAETFLGSATLLHQSELSFAQLRNEVTSKGGVTQRGLESLSASDFEQTILQSLNSALKRIDELRG